MYQIYIRCVLTELKHNGYAVAAWNKAKERLKPAPSPVPAPKPQPNLIAIDIPNKIYVTTKDANLWDLGFSSWGDAKSVKVLPKGTQIEVSAVVDHPLGGRYMVSEYSYSKGIMNGVNVADIVEYKSPAVPKPPEPEAPVVLPLSHLKKNLKNSPLWLSSRLLIHLQTLKTMI